jgi:hypothetical protein
MVKSTYAICMNSFSGYHHTVDFCDEFIFQHRGKGILMREKRVQEESTNFPKI